MLMNNNRIDIERPNKFWHNHHNEQKQRLLLVTSNFKIKYQSTCFCLQLEMQFDRASNDDDEPNFFIHPRSTFLRCERPGSRKDTCFYARRVHTSV